MVLCNHQKREREEFKITFTIFLSSKNDIGTADVIGTVFLSTFNELFDYLEKLEKEYSDDFCVTCARGEIYIDEIPY